METNASREPRWIGGIVPPSDVRSMSATALLEKECREQPERLAGLIRAYSEDESILEELRKIRQISLPPGPTVFIGMGASFFSSIAGSVLLQSCGRSSFTVDASEWLHYSLPAWDQVAVSILLTTSGESAELVQLCQKGRQKPLALICNNEHSTCWSGVQFRLPILAGPEYGNATKTYTNATAAGIVLASHITGRAWQEDAERVLEVYESDLNRVFGLRCELEEFCRGAANIEMIGRGPAYGGAAMGALCVREMSGHRAAAHTGGGFRHGPLLDVNASHVAIILALGREAGLGVKLAQDCLARGGKVILVGSEEQQASPKFRPITISAVPAPWEGLTSVLVPQALTLGMVERFGAKLPPRFHYSRMEE